MIILELARSLRNNLKFQPKRTNIESIVLKKPWKAFFFDYRRQDNIGPVECTGKVNLFKSE